MLQFIALFLAIVAALFIGYCMAALAIANDFSEFRVAGFRKQDIIDAVESTILPKGYSNSAAWNAALLDLSERLGIDQDIRQFRRKHE